MQPRFPTVLALTLSFTLSGLAFLAASAHAGGKQSAKLKEATAAPTQEAVRVRMSIGAIT